MLHTLAQLSPDIMGSVEAGGRPADRADVPRQRLGRALGGAATGAKLVLSADYRPERMCQLFRDEKVTHSRRRSDRLADDDRAYRADGRGAWPDLKQVTIGGSAAPRAMIRWLRDRGVAGRPRLGHDRDVADRHVRRSSAGWDEMSDEEQVEYIARQGRVPFGVELRIVDDEGNVLPRDGKSSGRLQCRGPWVIKRYFKAEEDATDDGQWFDTGDVAAIHPDGTMQITDRSKDVIKSGGEWISSIELENAAVGCPGVAEAAAIGIPHPKWDERPLLCVRSRERQ